MAALMPHTCEYPALPAHLLTCLQKQRRAGQLCDISIKVGDRSFPAHRGVLSACSGYFRALFTDRDVSSVELRLVTERGVSLLLDYMYTARLQLTAGDAQEVMLAAVYLQVTDIMEDCTSYLGHTFQQSQRSGHRSAVSMATMSQHGRQDQSDGKNGSGLGEANRWSHMEQSRESGGLGVAANSSSDAVNQTPGRRAGNRLEAVHDGSCIPANQMAGSQASVGKRLEASLTNHKPALQSDVGKNLEAVHDGRSSSTNHRPALHTGVGKNLEAVHDGRSSSTNHRPALHTDGGNNLEAVHDGRSSSTNHRPALHSVVGNNLEAVHDGRSSSTNHRPALHSVVGNKQEATLQSEVGHVGGSLEEEHDENASTSPMLSTVVQPRTSLVQLNLTDCAQSSQTSKRAVPKSPTVIVKQEPAEDDANLSPDVKDNSNVTNVDHRSDSAFPDGTFRSGAGSSSGSTEPASSSAVRINTIANTLFQQQQDLHSDEPNIQHQARAIIHPGSQDIQAPSFPPHPSGLYGPLNSLQGLLSMPSDPLGAVDLWPVTPDTRSSSLDPVFYNRHQNKHACIKCGAAFKYASSLRAHKLYKHSSARPFVCSVCGYSFKDKSMLKRHFRVHKKWLQPGGYIRTQAYTAAKDKASSSANSAAASDSGVEHNSNTGSDNTSMSKASTTAVQTESGAETEAHSNVGAMSVESGSDSAEGPILWTAEGGALLQATQPGGGTEDGVSASDKVAPPRVHALSPGTAARQAMVSDTVSQVNMFSTMLPRVAPVLLTSEGRSNVGDTAVPSICGRRNDLDIPRSHQQTTLTSGQASGTCRSAPMQGQVVIGNTATMPAVNRNNATSSMSLLFASTTQNPQYMLSVATNSSGESPSQFNPVAMETTATTPPKVFRCTECCAVFKYNSSLRAHKLYKHSNARPFICRDCGYAFKAKGMLQRHRRTQHPDSNGL